MWRKSAPLLLCLLGGCIWKLQEGWSGGVALLLAAICWGWALDLVSDRAAAKATKDAATRFYAMVMDDHQVEIIVTNRHTYHAASADLDVLAQAIEARRAATAKTGAVEDESAVPQGCAHPGAGQ